MTDAVTSPPTDPAQTVVLEKLLVDLQKVFTDMHAQSALRDQAYTALVEKRHARSRERWQLHNKQLRTHTKLFAILKVLAIPVVIMVLALLGEMFYVIHSMDTSMSSMKTDMHAMQGEMSSMKTDMKAMATHITNMDEYMKVMSQNMAQMSQNMLSMSQDMHAMNIDMGTMSKDMGLMRSSMQSMVEDVRYMRYATVSMDRGVQYMTRDVGNMSNTISPVMWGMRPFMPWTQ